MVDTLDFGVYDEWAKDTVRLKNIVEIIPGYDPSLRGEYIVLGSHDTLSGFQVLKNVSKMIADNGFMFRRSVVVAYFGGAEFQGAGSWYFLNRSFPESDKIRAMLDLNYLERSGGNNFFRAFTGVRNTALYKNISEAADRPFSITPQIVDLEPFASDYSNFYAKGIAAALFTTAAKKPTKPVEPYLIDTLQLRQIEEYVYHLALLSANETSYTVKETIAQGDRIFAQHEVDKRATFLRGDEKEFLRTWVYKYAKYPESAIAQGVEGNVVVEFVVNEKGNLTDIKITKGLCEEIDNEVIKVMKASPKWTPALFNGEKVPVKISLSVEFMLKRTK